MTVSIYHRPDLSHDEKNPKIVCADSRRAHYIPVLSETGFP
jgi:hypothetical protein